MIIAKKQNVEAGKQQQQITPYTLPRATPATTATVKRATTTTTIAIATATTTLN